MPLEVELRFVQLGPVRLGLEVEVHGFDLFGEFKRKRGLSCLSRPEQGYGGKSADPLFELTGMPRAIILANSAS